MRIPFLVFVLFVSLFASAALAQDPFGSIQGTITDPQGAVVPCATVTVRNLATNASRTAVTNNNGQYRILQLQPGNYEVKASAASFKQSVIESVQVQVGHGSRFDVELPDADADAEAGADPDAQGAGR